MNPFQVMAETRSVLLGGIFHQHFAIADNGVERRAQLMAQMGEKGLLSPAVLKALIKPIQAFSVSFLGLDVELFTRVIVHERTYSAKSAFTFAKSLESSIGLVS
jgi:hypothetical protein